MKKAISAAQKELPDGTAIVIIIAKDTEKGVYQNRVSNTDKEIANSIIIRWTESILHREDFDTPNQN